MRRAVAIALAIIVLGAAPVRAAPAQGEPLFIAHFKPTNAFGRAQHLAAQGRLAAARARTIAALKQYRSLGGLCFVRFTVGGAEAVLRFCVQPAQREATAAHVVARLRANPLIDYVDRNVAVDVNAH